jgi:hypothetical protein
VLRTCYFQLIDHRQARVGEKAHKEIDDFSYRVKIP